MNFKDIQIYLTDFSTRNNLVQHAKESCSAAIKNCIEENGNEEIGNHSLDELMLEFDTQSLLVHDWAQDKPYVRTRIGIYVEDKDKTWVRNLKPIGYYELDTDEEGNHFDDWLIFD